MNGMLPEWEFEDGAVILSSIGARCGKCFFPTGKWNSLANTQLIFPDSEKVDRRFLWYVLNDEQRWRRSGTAQAYIKPSDVKSNQIPLPPLSEQRRIASVLDQADALHVGFQKTIELLDELLSSEFSKLTASDDQAERLELGDLYSVSGGKRLPNGAPYASERTRHPYLRVTDMRNGSFATEHLEYLSPEVQRKIQRYTVSVDDLVVSIAGTIGLVSAVPAYLDGANLTENAARLRPINPNRVTSSFMRYQLASAKVQHQIRSATGQVTIGKLALFRIEKLVVSLPPLEIQQEFARIAGEVDRLRLLQLRALSLHRELMTGLRARAFAS